MENYSDFVVHKSERAVHTDSIVLTVNDLNDKLYDFQKDIVRWALAKGRAAIFADCGLGKTAMQLEWAHRVCVCIQVEMPSLWRRLPFPLRPWAKA